MTVFILKTSGSSIGRVLQLAAVVYSPLKRLETLSEITSTGHRLQPLQCLQQSTFAV